MLASFRTLLAPPLCKDDVVSAHCHCLSPSVLRKWCYKEPSACQSCFFWHLLQWNHREQWVHRFHTKIMLGFSFLVITSRCSFSFFLFWKKHIFGTTGQAQCGELTLYPCISCIPGSAEVSSVSTPSRRPWALLTRVQVSHAATFGFTGNLLFPQTDAHVWVTSQQEPCPTVWIDAGWVNVLLN